MLETLLTPKELGELENRLKILEMFSDGISQRQISSTLGVGIATVTRGAQAYNGNKVILDKYVSLT